MNSSVTQLTANQGAIKARSVSIDVLMGVTVSRLPELSQSMLSPSIIRGGAVSAFVKSGASVVRMSADTLLIQAELGDAVNWQMTSICDGFAYNVDVYDITFDAIVDMMTAPKFKPSNKNMALVNDYKMVNSAWTFKNYVLATDKQPARCEISFKVTEKESNKLVGYAIWRPLLMVRCPAR